MTVSVLFGRRKVGQIGELVLDAVITEKHSYTNEVSQYPVEDGSDINDNIRKLPAEITINGMVSNTPVDVLQANNAEVIQKIDGGVEVKNLRRTEVLNRVELAQDILLRISGRQIKGEPQDPELVTVITGLRVYQNMAITNLEIPRDITVGEAIKFDASLREVRKVSSESVEIPFASPDSVDRAQSTVEKGKTTATQPNSAEVTRTSAVKKFWNEASKWAAK
jgi:hypothetical protein